jgi:hypothetical protein
LYRTFVEQGQQILRSSRVGAWSPAFWICRFALDDERETTNQETAVATALDSVLDLTV